MTMNFPAPRNGSVWREPRAEESRAHTGTGEDRELEHRWHEESSAATKSWRTSGCSSPSSGSAALSPVKALSRVSRSVI